MAIDKPSADETRILALLQALYLRPTEEERTRALASLADFVVNPVNWNQSASQFGELIALLDADVSSAESYARLVEAIEQIRQGQMVQPTTIPAPDFTFLQPATSLPQLLAAAFARIGSQLTVQLSGDLLPWLRPTLKPSSARSAGEQRYAEQILHLAPEDSAHEETPVTVDIFRDGQQPSQCLVEVVVEPPDRTWPALEGIAVSLHLLDDTQVATTDAWGMASFPNVAIAGLPSLMITIELDE